METKIGIIKAVSQKSGMGSNNKPYKKFVFEMEDGKIYSTFDSDIGNTFKTGDSIVMEGEQNGKYWNMKTMALSDQKIESVNTENAFKEHSDKDKSIIAQCLTKCVSEIVSNNPAINIDAVKANVLDAYKFFYESL